MKEVLKSSCRSQEIINGKRPVISVFGEGEIKQRWIYILFMRLLHAASLNELPTMCSTTRYPKLISSFHEIDLQMIQLERTDQSDYKYVL